MAYKVEKAEVGLYKKYQKALDEINNNIKDVIDKAGKIIMSTPSGSEQEKQAETLLKGLILTPFVELHKEIKTKQFEGKDELLKKIIAEAKKASREIDNSWALWKDRRGLESPMVGEDFIILPACFMKPLAKFAFSSIPTYIGKSAYARAGEVILKSGARLPASKLSQEAAERAVSRGVDAAKAAFRELFEFRQPSDIYRLLPSEVSDKVATGWLPKKGVELFGTVNEKAFKSQFTRTLKLYQSHLSGNTRLDWIKTH